MEKAYVSSAGGYLKTQNEQGLVVARAMAGINTGETTLGDLREAIKRARFVTNAAWQGDYLKFGKLVVPPSFTAIDHKIRHSHSLRESAFKEWLEYWKDNNPSHIESGTATFKRSEQIAQEAVKELTAAMTAMKK
jgi:hypothetical protein